MLRFHGIGLYSLQQVPLGVPLAAAATLPTNVYTAYLTLSDKLGLDLSWPRPSLLPG